MVSPGAIIFAFYMGRAVIEGVHAYFEREGDTIRACLARFQVPSGPKLTLEQALRDVSDANRALADASIAPDTPRPGWRYKATLSYRPGVAQAAFFRALKVGPRVAALVGRVDVDLEEVPVSRQSSNNIVDDDEGVSLETLATTRETPSGDDIRGVEGNEAGEDDDDDFEHVSVCRRATLAEFYTLIRPALAQIAVNNVPRSVHLTPLSRADGDGDGTHEEETCSICMDEANAVDTVTRCGHAFCSECYARWLTRSRECPLCRQHLACHGGAYELVQPGDLAEDEDGGEDGAVGAEPAVDVEFLKGRLAALPIVSEPRRRAWEASMIRKLMEGRSNASEA